MLFTLRAYDYPHQQTVVSRSLAHPAVGAFLYDGATPSMRTWWFYDDGLSAPVENPHPTPANSGTGSSNPSPSSGEMVWGRRRGDGTIVAAAN